MMGKDKNWINNYFSEDDLRDIESSVKVAELKTTGEIVVFFQQKRSWLEKLYNFEELTLKHFYSLGVNNTRDKTGVLLFILFEERHFNILADEGIHKKIPKDAWDDMEHTLKEEFSKGNYLAGVKSIVNEIGNILSKEFPATGINDDEIPNKVKLK